VILLDSDSCNLQLRSNLKTRLHLLEFRKARDLTRVFRHGCSFDDTTSQNKQPIFRMIVDGFEQREFTNDTDLCAATMFVRNIIRSIWEEDVMRESVDVHDIQLYDKETQRSKSLLLSPGTTSRVSNYKHYRQLMFQRQRLREKKPNYATSCGVSNAGSLHKPAAPWSTSRGQS
jgi:hypothetical protein